MTADFFRYLVISTKKQKAKNETNQTRMSEVLYSMAPGSVNQTVAGLIHIPYARHHNPLLIRNRSWILTIHKALIFWKNLLENKEITFQNGVESIQAAAYNGARTVYGLFFCTDTGALLIIYENNTNDKQMIFF